MATEESETEQQLKLAAMEVKEIDDSNLDFPALAARANRQVGMRDALHLGFAHLVTTMLTLLSGIYRRLNQSSENNNKTHRSTPDG